MKVPRTARHRTKQALVRIGIHLRVSTAQQREGYGLKVQEDGCRAWIAKMMRGNSHVTVDVYVDGGVSGKLTGRDDLERMTADARAGRLDVIVFGRLDRIGRTMKNIHRWVYDMTDRGIRVATGDDRIDSDDARDALVRVGAVRAGAACPEALYGDSCAARARAPDDGSELRGGPEAHRGACGQGRP